MEFKNNKLRAGERVVTKVPNTNRKYVLRELVDKIAKYLNTKDLGNLAQTCRLWRKAVAREMQLRCLQRVLFFEERNLVVLQGFANVNSRLVILFAKHDFTRVKRREETLREQCKNHFPNMLITIGFDEIFTESNVIKSDLPEYDEKINFANFNTSEVPGLLIPNHSTVEVKMVSYTVDEIKAANSFSNIFDPLVSKNYKEKSILLVFTHGFNRTTYLEMMMRSLEESFRREYCTLWGGELFHSPYVHDSRKKESNISDCTVIVAVSITSPNLESYSFVLNIDKIDTSVFLEEIRKFRDKIRFRRQNIGLVIAPEFEDFQLKLDEAECNVKVQETVDDFFRKSYEKKLVYFLKKLFPEVSFTVMFQDNVLNFFGISCVNGQYRFYHTNSISVMIITHG